MDEHFKDYLPHPIDITRHEDMTLRERLTRGIHARNRGGGKARLGSAYWSEMRALYREEAAGAVAQGPFWLSPDEKELDLDNGLVSALTQAMAANTTTRTKGALQDWLCGCKSMNKRELVGASRHMVPFTFERPCCLRVASWVLKCILAIVSFISLP